jgi:hypothetical protein
MSNIQFWRPVYQLFKPDQPLANAATKHFYVQRQDSPVDSLLDLLAMEDGGAKFLLAGHPGSGKTTELRRLERNCESDYTVVWVDTDTALDKYNIGYAEVIVLIGITIVQRLDDSGWELPKHLLEALLKSLSKVTQQDKTSGGGQLELPKLFQDLGAQLKVGFQRETTATREIRPTLSEIIGRVNDIIVAAAAAEAPKLLVIVDGLDRKEYRLALEMFSSSLMTDLHCHVIYAIPISLRYSPAFRQPMQSFEKCLDLVNIPVVKCDPQGRPTTAVDEDGIKLLNRVIEQRLQKLGGEYKDLFQPDAAALLCQKSGGVMRDLVRLARTACEVALRQKTEQIDLAIAQKAVREDYRTYSIEDYHFPELDQVNRTGKLTSNSFDSPKHGRSIICDDLLHYKLILGYQDPQIGRWFDVNPILMEELVRWRAASKPEEGQASQAS